MYLLQGGPGNIKEQAEALGVDLPPDELEPDDLEVEPECWDSVLLFARICTQWRMGPAGPTGLDLNVALSILRLQEVERDVQIEMLDDLAVMEQAWLEALRKDS